MGIIEDVFQEHLTVLECSRELLVDGIRQAAETITDCYRNGNKVLLFGNGGSAADAMHIEGELISRFKKERDGLPAIAVGCSIPALTAASNDSSYITAMAHFVKALARPGDVAIAISTSGTSANVVEAARAAVAKGVHVIALTGEGGGDLEPIAQQTVCVPSKETARIQEIHITIGHIICEIVEKELFGRC